MANSITNRQMFFILIMTLTSYTSIDLPKIVAEKAGRTGWMMVLAAAVAFSLAALIITKLNNRFPGQAMFDYSGEIAGKLVSRVIAVFYLLYFVLVGVYLKVRLVNFLTANFLPKTPQCILLAFSVMLFAYVAYKGVTSAARLYEMFGVLFLITTIVLCVLMLFQGMLYNIRPFFNPNEAGSLVGLLPHLMFPFGGIEVLLIVPFTQKNKKAPLAAFLTLLFIGLLYVLIVESTICILGINNTILYNDAFIEAIKIVSVPVIERTDIFYLTVGLMSLFAGMIIVFLSSLEFACRLFPRVRRLVITPVLAAVLYGLCLAVLGVSNIGDILDSFAPYLVTTSAFAVPGLLLLIAAARKKRGAAQAGGGA